MKGKDLTGRYAAIQFGFWTCFAAIVPFSSFYLLGKGLTNTEIGIIIAAAGAVAAFLQPVVGTLMDRFPSVSSSGVLTVIFGLLIADSLALAFLQEISRFLTGILYGFMILTVQLTSSLLNVVGVDSMAHGNRVNFNIARGAGSLAYALAAWGLGLLTVKLPSAVIPVTVAVFAAVIVIVSGTYPVGEKKAVSAEMTHMEASGPIDFLKHYPVFVFLLPSLTMIYFSHAVLNNYTLQIVKALGAGNAEMGTGTAIAAASEIIIIIGFGFLKKRFNIRTLLRISGSAFAVKNILTVLATSVAGFYGAQVCQMFAWGIMCVAIVYYVNEIIPEKDRAKGQTYAGMTMTAANVLGAVIGGRMIDTGGIRPLLITGCVICIGGTLLLLPATRKPTLYQTGNR